MVHLNLADSVVYIEYIYSIEAISQKINWKSIGIRLEVNWQWIGCQLVSDLQYIGTYMEKRSDVAETAFLAKKIGGKFGLQSRKFGLKMA